MCRADWQGHPAINTQIKNVIESVFADKITERLKEEDPEINDIVKKFDAELSNEKGELNKHSDVTSFCSGIIVAFGVVVVAYLAWYWQASDSHLLVNKPVQTWKSKDVATWISELGWAKVYAPSINEKQIDGTLLLSLDEKSLESRLNMTDNTHQRALLFAINVLREQGVKMPATLWEYKAIYPGRCLFLVFSLKDFPRTTMLYLWLYFHDDMFIPFLKATSRKADLSIPVNSTDEDFSMKTNITTSEWVSFLFLTLVLPEWLVATFAYQMTDRHLMTPLFVLTTALLYTVLELLTWLMLYKEMGRSLLPLIKIYLKQLMSAFMFMVLWPVVPTLLCDILFYGALYISPIHALLEVCSKFRELNER